MTNKELPEGYKIFITHFRRFPGSDVYMTTFDAKSEGFDKPMHSGGATEAFIVNEDGEAVAAGLAMCSERENFSKKIGRNIAIGRAKKNWGLIERSPVDSE